MVLYRTEGVEACPRCGFALYKLDMCRRTNTCVLCAREVLGAGCSTCASKRECDIALRGLSVIKGIEHKMDVVVDAAKSLFDRSTSSISLAVKDVEAFEGVIDVGIALILGFLITSADPASEFPHFFRKTFKPNFVKFVSATPIIKLVEAADVIRGVCEELGKGCEKLADSLEALYNYILLSAVISSKRKGCLSFPDWYEENIAKF